MICGILLGLGAAAGGVYIMNSANHDPLLTRVQSGDDKATALTEKATKMKDAALMVRRMVDIAPSLEEAWVPRATAKDGKLPRFTPLFFAPSIWEVPDAAQKKNVAVDLLDNESRPLHKMASADASTPAVPVPNSWFFSHGLGNIICSSLALQTDSDGDGFTNGEEFSSGTDPSNAKSMPGFVSGGGIKMEVVGDKDVITHLLELSLGSNFDEKNVNISVFSDNGQRKLQFMELKEGQKFGLGDAASGPLAKERFELVSVENASEENGMPVYSVIVKDAYTAVDDEKQFKLVAGNKGRRTVQDVSVKLRMTAGPDKGKEFTARLGEELDVPGFPQTRVKITSAGKKKTQVKASVNHADPVDVPSDAPVTPKKNSDKNKKK